MKCCENCFADIEIKAIISKLNQNGSCDYCGEEDVSILDLTTDKQFLSDMFDTLLDIYSLEAELPADYPRKKLKYLKDILYEDWNIFNLDENTLFKLVKEICSENYNDNSLIFTEKLGISEIVDSVYLEKYSILRTYDWKLFVDEIKSRNRFHTNHINTKQLSEFISYTITEYKSKSIFYRGRICTNEEGYKKREMGAPPAKIATAGRVNPEGISCLYLADSPETAVHEIRAGMYDFVTIGEFEVLNDLKIIDLTKIDKISPFFSTELIEYAINFGHLKDINKAIAKPLRKQDSVLDYIPTQYICEFIKNQGYDGVQYTSTMSNSGFNIAIFDEHKLNCCKVFVIDIESIEYNWVNL